jgi:hypothetical protein
MKRVIGTLTIVALMGAAGCATTFPGYAVYSSAPAPGVAPGYVVDRYVAPGRAVVPAYTVYGATAPAAVAVDPRTRTYAVEEGLTLPDALARDVEGGIPIYR